MPRQPGRPDPGPVHPPPATPSGPLAPLRRARVALRVLGETGLLRTDVAVSTARAFRHWGSSLATGPSAAALRRPEAVAVVDEAGELTFGALDRRTNAIAHGLATLGVGAGDGVGILCRNHRGFVEACVAVAKLGADILFLNTGFAAPQLREVLDREKAGAVIHDEEFDELVEAGAGSRPRVVAWRDRSRDGGGGGPPSLDALAASHSPRPLPRPPRPGRATILTSGTTGTPKGARRESASGGPDTVVGLLERIPLRAGEVHVIAAPIFHSWGLAHLLLAGALGSTAVLRRRFDPEATLADVARTRADVLAVVPVMLQRILALPEEVRRRYDTRSLRVVASSGSALPGELALRWMDAFGDNLYNLYGSTEVAQASIATPTDLRAAPGTAGRPPFGSRVRLLDEHGREVERGAPGRIFVANDAQFDGYTGGGSKEVIAGLMSTGDVGHFDAEGRLFVDGRDDDMIVSGGENVFPKEVEDLLADHRDVADVAVVGVPDDEFGQRLRAFVVPRPGRTPEADALRAYVREHLARYKVPRDVIFLEEIPRNATGKVLKRELRRIEPEAIGEAAQ